jgi:cation diffusion facilitator family transporter
MLAGLRRETCPTFVAMMTGDDGRQTRTSDGTQHHDADLVRVRKFAGRLSLLVGVLMLVAKMGAFLLTGSSAILSDALESVVHVVATAFALYSVVLSAHPPDETHPYGHGKVEFFSAGFEGALIIIAAIAIVYEAVPSLLHGVTLEKLGVGAFVVGGAGLVNLILGLYLIHTGKKTRSLTLVADGKHVLTDSYTSIGVLAGLLLVIWTGWTLLDPLVAIAVAVNIVWTGGRLVFQSVKGLMDAADPKQLAKVVRVISDHRRIGWIDLHRLRILNMGDRQHVDLHLTVPRFWDVERGHDEQAALEKVLDAQLPEHTEVAVHLDPCVPACCEFCEYEPCPVRAVACRGTRPWTVTSAIAPADYLEDDSD